jgi:ribonuclease HI
MPRRPTGAGELFASPPQAKPEKYLVAHIDGGARGNPGPAGYGVVVEDESGRPIQRLSQYLGRQTNNFAEYSALLAALQFALQHGTPALKVVSDSELLVKQMKGQYKVRSAPLIELHRRARVMADSLKWFRIEHVRRERNREADRLANQAMDQGPDL